jgi:putative inorganic carbon (HCO3(-)) transporter
MIFSLPFSKAGLEIFTWLGFFLWTLKRFLGYRTAGTWGLLPATPINRMLVIFLLVNMISTVLSFHWGLSFKALLGKQLKFLVVFFMVTETINTDKRLKHFLFVLLGSSIFIAADAVIQYVRGVDLIRGIPFGRLSAAFVNPNGFAGWLLILIFILIGGVFVRDSKFLGWRIKSLFAGAFMVLSVCLLLTYSRGAWLGAVVGALFFCQYAFRKISLRQKEVAVLAVVVLLTGMLIFSHRMIMLIDRSGNFQTKFGETLGQRIKSIPDSNATSTAIRIKLWKEALHIWKDFPLTGSGLNTYARISPQYKSCAEGGIYPHNSFLQMAAETGVLGLGAFLWVLFVFFKEGWQHIERYKSFLVLGLLSGILAFLVHSFVDSNLYQLQLVVLFWFMMGLTVAIMKLEQDGSEYDRGKGAISCSQV